MSNPSYGARGTYWTDASGTMYYKIAKWDTLWTIAEKFYGKGTDYTKIYNLNLDKIHDPHWIYPDHIIRIKTGQQVDSQKAPTTTTPQPATTSQPKPKEPPKWTDGNFMENKPVMTVSKQEYTLGIYDTEIKSTTYEKANAFIISPKFENKNIREVSISVDETHPTLNSDNLSTAVIPGTTVSDIVTSVEYYISYGADWYPILPSNVPVIKNELLFFNNGSAKLRFTADPSYDNFRTKVYKDGVWLDDTNIQQWFLTSDRQHIVINSYDSTANYTIDYVPLKDEHNDPTKLLLNDSVINGRLKTITDVFEDGTDANMKVVLSQIPYVNRNIINGEEFDPNVCLDDVINGTNNYPVSIIIDDSDFVGKSGKQVPVITQDVSDNKEIHLKNITDYTNQDVPALNSFDALAYPFIEFYHLGRFVYFPERFKYGSDLDNIKSGAHGNGRISVSYKYPDINIKIKVICRRTTDKYDTYITPTVTSIKVDAKAIS